MSRITSNYLIDENGTYTLSDNLKSVFDKCTGNDDNFSKELYKQYRNDETDSICAFYKLTPTKVYNIYKKKGRNEIRKTCVVCGGNLKSSEYLCCSYSCSLKSPGLQSKRKENNLKKYGVENYQQLDSYKNKCKKTCLERYGTTSYSKTDEYKEKCKQVWQENYGVDNPFQSEEIKEKMKQTWIENYGVDNPNKSQAIREKYKQTCEEKYGEGIVNTFQSEEIKEKIRKTNLERYGVDNPGKSKEILEKIKKINIEKYGLDYYNHWVLYELDNFTFDSAWEVVFYLYYRDKGCVIKRNDKHFTYIKDNKEHDTMVDFTIDGILYEIKSSFIINTQQEKIKMLKENNVNIISDDEIKMYFNYVYEKYGKEYIKQFRIK